MVQMKELNQRLKLLKNALDKTLLLRGVEFNLNIEPERKELD